MAEHEHIREIRAWAEAQSNGDSNSAMVAKRLLNLIQRIETLTDEQQDEEKHLGRELADLAFDVAKAHGMTPWEFFKNRA